jgi:type III secretion system FlhB-like substrate exporter
MYDGFIEYAQKYPKQYAIASSALCISLLEKIAGSGATADEIKKMDQFHMIELEDLKTLLNMLVKIRLLCVEDIGPKEIYYSGKFTNEFLQQYYKTKKNYDI